MSGPQQDGIVCQYSNLLNLLAKIEASNHRLVCQKMPILGKSKKLAAALRASDSIWHAFFTNCSEITLATKKVGVGAGLSDFHSVC